MHLHQKCSGRVPHIANITGAKETPSRAANRLETVRHKTRNRTRVWPWEGGGPRPGCALACLPATGGGSVTAFAHAPELFGSTSSGISVGFSDSFPIGGATMGAMGLMRLGHEQSHSSVWLSLLWDPPGSPAPYCEAIQATWLGCVTCSSVPVTSP